MIDEKNLQERLTELAAGQDDLYPRALADDLASGRRRLLRRRLLTGGSALVGAAVVAGVALTMPVLTTASDEAPVTTSSVDQQAAVDKLMRTVLADHLDPEGKHLNYSSGPFTLNQEPGHRAVTNRVGWRMPGQSGEGQILVSLEWSYRWSNNFCGKDGFTCRSAALPGGGMASIGRKGGETEIHFTQPDGEHVYVAVSPRLANNTEIPVRNMGITDAQLLAFVADPRLELPQPSREVAAKEAKLAGFQPQAADVLVAARKHLRGDLEMATEEDLPGQYEVQLWWKNKSPEPDVYVAVDGADHVSACHEQLSVTACREVVLPGGGKAMYAEEARQYQGGPRYVIGATWRQPDGDVASVRLLYPGRKRPAAAVSKEAILALVTDHALDK